MAISQLPQAPYRQDRRVYPTPDSGDILFSEVRDCTRSEIPEYGTPHPNPKKWPDHKLVFVKTVDIERDGIFEFFYAADRENQDLYNFSVGYRNIIGNVGGREFRVVQRSYITPRADFQPLDIPFGTPMPNAPEGKFDDVEYVFFDRQQQPIDQQELNSLYVAEVHTYVEKAFLDEKLSYTAQRNDPLPEKFQILVPEQAVEQIVEGRAEMPTLTGSELSVKEDQLNPDVKLVRTTSRDRSTLPVSLGQKATTNEKQLATITETVQTGDTDDQPTATINIQSQALGDGTYVVTKTEVPELFTAKSFTKQRTDPTPEKFRVFIPAESTEENIIGQAQMPNLASGDLESSEQQINKFVKRKRTTKRNKPSSEVTLNGSQSYVGGTVAKITETYSPTEVQADSGFLIQESRVSPTGDGAYIKETVSVEGWPTLISADWDDTLNALSIKRQTIQDPNNIAELQIPNTTKRTSYEAVNEDRTVRIEEFAPANIVDYVSNSKTRINLNIPPVLKKIEVKYEYQDASGDYEESGSDNVESITDGTVGASYSANVSATVGIKPVLDIVTEQIWASDIIATNYFYFVDDPDNYLSELNRITGLSILEWPIFKTKSYSITAYGGTNTTTLRGSGSKSVSVSADREAISKSEGFGESRSYGGDIQTARISQCLCAGISIENSSAELEKTIRFKTSEQMRSRLVFTSAAVRPSSFEATSPPDVPRSGLYVVDSRVEPYKWGYYRAIATVIDASQFA
jgi:hypothetical protein